MTRSDLKRLSSDEEALRLNDRYLAEAVERFDICPWARATRRDGRLRRRVLSGSEPSVALVLEAIDTWRDESEVDVGLLLAPDFSGDRQAFERWVGRCAATDSRRYRLDSPPFAFAAFHPGAAADFSSPDTLVPYLRASPAPTIQLVRMTALERVRADEISGTQFLDTRTLDLDRLLTSDKRPTLRERIARNNFETLKASRAEWDATQASIRAEATRSRTQPPGDRETECATQAPKTR